MEIPELLLIPSKTLDLVIEYEGGIGIVPVTPRPEPGERSTSLKILEVQSSSNDSACSLRLSVAGIGGNTYSLQAITTLPNLRADSLRLQKTNFGFEIEIPFSGSGYVTRQVCISDSTSVPNQERSAH